MTDIIKASLQLGDFDRAEIKRYASVRGDSEMTDSLLDECISLCDGVFSPLAVYIDTPVTVTGSRVDLGFVTVSSDSLSRYLGDSDRAVIFVATVGAEIDRLILRYSLTSPSRAVILDAIGSERAESLCDSLSESISREYSGCLDRRFSPGYGDLPLEIQRDIFLRLDCPRKIGVTLTDSCLMRPIKSVSAIIGRSTKK